MSTPNRNVVVRRPRKATPIADIEKQFHLFVTNWRMAAVAGKARDKARDNVKAWFDKGGDSDHEISVNENGSQIVAFDEPVLVDGVRITGLENRRTVTSGLDLDRVDAWLESLPKGKREELSRRLYREVTDTVFQPDELFKLQQEGVISEPVMDSLFETDVKWALCVTKD
jgi:hypothetical protein